MSTCRSCGKSIEWGVTEKGKKMPLDPEVIPHDEASEGDYLLTEGGKLYRVTKARSLPNVKGRVSHFATCPQAGEWRKQ